MDLPPLIQTPTTVTKFSSNRDIAVVQADYLALANDLEQAQALSSTLEMQLCGKNNELAQFKAILERSQGDLVKFAQDLDTMRTERHALANELQCAYAIEHRYEKLKALHEALGIKANQLEGELQREREAHAQTRAEMEALRARTPRNTPAPGLPNMRDPQLRQSLETLRTQLDRVLGPAQSRETSPAPTVLKPEVEHIEIEFSA